MSNIVVDDHDRVVVRSLGSTVIALGNPVWDTVAVAEERDALRKIFAWVRREKMPFEISFRDGEEAAGHQWRLRVSPTALGLRVTRDEVAAEAEVETFAAVCSDLDARLSEEAERLLDDRFVATARKLDRERSLTKLMPYVELAG